MHNYSYDLIDDLKNSVSNLQNKNSCLQRIILEIEDICYSERSDRDVGIDIRNLLNKGELNNEKNI